MTTHTEEVCKHQTEGLALARTRTHYAEKSHIAEILGHVQEYLNLRNMVTAIDEEMSLNLMNHRATCEEMTTI